jgi:nitrate reductase NapAB chaperone NapD
MKSQVEVPVCSNKIVVVVLETNDSEMDLCYAVGLLW